MLRGSPQRVKRGGWGPRHDRRGLCRKGSL